MDASARLRTLAPAPSKGVLAARPPTTARRAPASSGSDVPRLSMTRNACLPCRRRKAKCNGKHPVCSRCREGGLKCQYDVSSERITKMANLKAKVTQLGRSVGDLELVLESLRLSSDDEAAALLARLRLGESPVELVRSLKAGELVRSSGTVPFSQRRTPADAVLSPSPSDMGSCEDDDELQESPDYLTPESASIDATARAIDGDGDNSKATGVRLSRILPAPWHGVPAPGTKQPTPHHQYQADADAQYGQTAHPPQYRQHRQHQPHRQNQQQPNQQQNQQRQHPQQQQGLQLHRTSPYSALGLSSAIRANHYPSYVQNHQLNSMNLPLHLLHPLHLVTETDSSVPSHLLSNAQGEFVAHARRLVLQLGVQKVLGGSLLTAENLVDNSSDSNAAEAAAEESVKATDIQSWSKGFMAQFHYIPFADRVALNHLLLWFMRWLVFPCAETYSDMPEWLRPTQASVFVPHLSIYSTAPWGELRDYMILQPSEMVLMFAATVTVNWPHSDAAIFAIDDASGATVISQLFLAHVRNQANWTLDLTALSAHPQLRGLANFRERP